MALLGGLAVSLPVSQTQFKSLQLPLHTAPPQLHPGGPGFSCLQRLPQTLPLRLQTHLSSTLLIQLILQRWRVDRDDFRDQLVEQSSLLYNGNLSFRPILQRHAQTVQNTVRPNRHKAHTDDPQLCLSSNFTLSLHKSSWDFKKKNKYKFPSIAPTRSKLCLFRLFAAFFITFTSCPCSSCCPDGEIFSKVLALKTDIWRADKDTTRGVTLCVWHLLLLHIALLLSTAIWWSRQISGHCCASGSTNTWCLYTCTRVHKRGCVPVYVFYPSQKPAAPALNPSPCQWVLSSLCLLSSQPPPAAGAKSEWWSDARPVHASLQSHTLTHIKDGFVIII